ncbi:hypothetical protein, partial [Aeromonas taiwanensis]|uniref:hypothetical protein n=1 Tax=Aeromonas taiwanensis TaxID=633417 RepID=UPI00207D0AEF
MSKSCCGHSHASPIKGIVKAAPHEHQHDSHCCDNATQDCQRQAPRDHQEHGAGECTGDEDPPARAKKPSPAHHQHAPDGP